MRFFTVAGGLLLIVSAPLLAQTSLPPAVEPSAFCLSLANVSTRPPRLESIFRPEINPLLAGYRTTLHIFKRDSPRCEFSGDDTIWFLMDIENATDEHRILSIFSTTAHADLYVLHPGTDEVLYRWLIHQITDDFPDTLFFGPGETKSFYTWWDRVDDAGQPVPAGPYDVIGVTVGAGLYPPNLDTPHPLGSTRRRVLLD
ncbi:MAG: hypothetical protein OEV00_11145 [Acidobacteriota bacterium]|nr:hypothetical protein [Acidobacteriota bacterium]MDH3785868.1 hypothetical protein [Acidobacteriota bacterium]